MDFEGTLAATATDSSIATTTVLMETASPTNSKRDIYLNLTKEVIEVQKMNIEAKHADARAKMCDAEARTMDAEAKIGQRTQRSCWPT
jgi:hypothetical protein